MVRHIEDIISKWSKFEFDLNKTLKHVSDNVCFVCFSPKKLPHYTSTTARPNPLNTRKKRKKFHPSIPIKDMGDWIFEVACDAASSTLFIFCFCNFIILTILFFSSFDDDISLKPLSIVIHSNTDMQQSVCQNLMLQQHPMIDVAELPVTQNESESESDDDFRRRVEEFIETVNRGWKEERQSTSRRDHPNSWDQ